MRRGSLLAFGVGVCAALAGCAAWQSMPQDRRGEPPVATWLAQVRGDVERSVGTQQAVTLKALAEAATDPVPFTPPFVAATLADPWTGFESLERRLLRVAAAAPASRPLPDVLVALEALSERQAAPSSPLTPPASTRAEDHLAYLEALLAEAARLREQAIGSLTDEERQFLFEQASVLAERFTPQWSEQDEDERLQALADRRFFALAGEKLDHASLLAAAQLLASLDDEAWLDRIRAAFADRPALPHPTPGITGPVLLYRETPWGLLIVGGTGPNTYEPGRPVALLVDLGGDDVYRGTVAAAMNVTHGISAVLDLDGNDRYEAASLGLATGRLGVGLLVDRRGHDRYRLEAGSGGVGLAGIGLLDDREGDDRYIGSRLTQGAAIGGLGLLVDRLGDDTYDSFGYALGFGGPRGTGALIDVDGRDRYQCGDRFPSRYNEQDAPQAKPGDPSFQYECFGLGAGVGQRLMPKLDRSTRADTAGGIGLVLDLAGDDRSRSGNFSQGVGYAFGTGVKLDLGGDDEHVAARYGHGAAAHFSVGLFVDAAGRDRYGSTGPEYNAAAAWDRSVALFVDAGASDDRYDFERSTGLGIAEHRAWSLFLDAGGTNRYAVRRGKGTAGIGSVSIFIGR